MKATMAESHQAVLRKFSDASAEFDRTEDATEITDRYGRNVTALSRRIPLVLRPRDEADVRQAVKLANQHGVSLYPVSTGKNWGLGSKLPVTDGCVVLDLSRMDRVIEVSEAGRYAIIEAGVTQGQLARHLSEHHRRLTLNLTGSFAETSIAGNVLDRGDGAYARIDDLLGVSGILGNGRPFAVGGVWERVGATARPSHLSRYMAGPDLVGLFSQSNFAVVTRMAFRLLDKPERRYLFWGSAEDNQLERLVDEFDRLGAQGAVKRGAVNIGYANRFVQGAHSVVGVAATEPLGERAGVGETWNLYAIIDGTARLADATLGEVREAIEPLCVSAGQHLVGSDPDPTRPLPPFLRPLIGPLTGTPDGRTLEFIYRMTQTPLPEDPRALDADHTPFGMKCCVPLIPTRGKDARAVARIVTTVRRIYPLNIKTSFFGDGRTLITIHFDRRDPVQVAQAEQAEAKLWDALSAAGYFAYRLSIDQMRRAVAQRPEFFALARQIKSLFDPNGVISPGRYSPT